MSNLTPGQLFEAYKQWVCSNPNLVTDVENFITWTSYFFAGRVSNSPITSEIVYSSCKLLALFNDQIIRETYTKDPPSYDSKEKIKLTITVLHYFEVFNELLLKWKFGEKGKWRGIVILRLIKSALSLILLHKYKQMPISNPPIPLLQRQKFIKEYFVDENKNEGFVLKRSRRIIRSVNGSPSVSLRDWLPPKHLSEADKIKKMTYAESLYIIKPLLHLASLKAVGEKSWAPWLISLGADFMSLRLYSEVYDLSQQEKTTLRQRFASLLLYMLRSPMYDKYTNDMIKTLLISLSNKIPITKLVSEPLIHYMKHWQEIYFYMWSN